MKTTTQKELESKLNSFDAIERQESLRELVKRFPEALSEPSDNVNMHMHSFFSYNAFGWSPSRVAWESKKAGLSAAGLCDFDVLDGMQEFLEAGDTLELRTSVSIETRAYLHEMSDLDINSPGEPGVCYIMGAGFYQTPKAGTNEAKMLKSFRERYDSRNEASIALINKAYPGIAINYERDAVPLTPAGGVTERHLLKAYREQSATSFASRPADEVQFWSKIFKKSTEETQTVMQSIPDFENAIRSALMKKGGVGYEQPSASSFPPVDDFIEWVSDNDALPMIAWLDGSSEGESDPATLLECLCVKGAVALNIIPDRNWNFDDLSIRETKARNLAAIVQEAERMFLPINIGTEMNKLGLPFVDDLAGPILHRYADIFLRGAFIMAGHTLMGRFADFPYNGSKARAQFESVSERNEFFANVGKARPLTLAQVDKLKSAGSDRAFAHLIDHAAGRPI